LWLRSEEAQRRTVARYRERRELLAACGVIPEDVKTVFVTHLHYDHWAGYELFPNATYFIQEREIAFWQGRAALSRSLRVAQI